MKLKKGDIVLVEFPYSDFSDFKIRPALVVVDLEGENAIFAQITSKKSSFLKYQVELQDAVLRHTSYIKVDKLINLHKSLFVSKVSSIPKEVEVEVNKKLKRLFKL